MYQHQHCSPLTWCYKLCTCYVLEPLGLIQLGHKIFWHWFLDKVNTIGLKVGANTTTVIMTQKMDSCDISTSWLVDAIYITISTSKKILVILVYTPLTRTCLSLRDHDRPAALAAFLRFHIVKADRITLIMHEIASIITQLPLAMMPGRFWISISRKMQKSVCVSDVRILETDIASDTTQKKLKKMKPLSIIIPAENGETVIMNCCTTITNVESEELEVENNNKNPSILHWVLPSHSHLCNMYWSDITESSTSKATM